MKYGILLDEFVMYSVNAFGLVVTSVCLYFYYQYTHDKVAMEKITLYTLVFLTTVLAYVRVCYDSLWVPDVLNQLGLLACSFTMIMFGSPLLSLSKVIRTKSVTGHISLPVAALSLAVCILWTCVGCVFFIIRLLTV